MAIVLFTDFGSNDLYVGQVEAVLDRFAPGMRVIDLLHEAPAFDVESSAHLLAALAPVVPRGSVFIGVVDPGVGTERDAVVLRADGRWFVGPDNGLFSVVAARAMTSAAWKIAAYPLGASPSFHGRDVFAPMAAAVATDDFPNDNVVPIDGLQVRLPAEDLARVVYADHYGNLWTGLRAKGLPRERRLQIAGREVQHSRVFGEVPAGDLFWYENSSGLVELAANRASAAALLGAGVGTTVSWAPAAPVATPPE
jgi:S-adenosylmethionine hydrolase